MKRLVCRDFVSASKTTACNCGSKTFLARQEASLPFRQRVSTKSALWHSFNSIPQKKYDFWAKNSGLFLVPELSTPEGFMREKDKAIKRGWKLLDEAVSVKPGKETIVLFDELSDTLCRVADLADFVRCTHPDRSFLEAANETHLAIGTMVEELNTHKDLHNAMRAVVDNKNLMESFDEETRRVAKLFMFDFEISGIHLDSTKRSQAVKLHEEILSLTSRILQGSGATMTIPKSLLPIDMRHLFSGNNDKDVVNLAGLHAEHPDERIRELAYRLYLSPDEEMGSVLSRLLEARYELSHLVGYESFAERALKSTMAQTPENVMRFLHTLSANLIAPAAKEFSEMKRLKKQSGSTKELMTWDVHYFTSKMKEHSSSINAELYSNFFSLGDCMEGLNLIFQSLYGVTLQSVDTKKGEVWSSDIIKLAVMHETEGRLGYIYCDFFQRPCKPQQDCHFTIRGGRRLPDGSYQLPVVVLLLHLPSPCSTMPTLLHPSSVNNLFHEAGHAMHSMLARTRYQHVTGTRCATDFAEVPSILMEHYISNETVLSKFAKHHRSRQPMPEEMIQTLCEADNICVASEMQAQVFYSLLDQAFHGLHPLPQSLYDIFAKLHNEHYGLPHVPNTAWYLRFSHLATYGAKYYSYLMSRAVASRLWEKCFSKDPLSRTMGSRYRSKMLSYGGAKNPIHMYEDMLEEEFNMDKLANTLVNAIK